MKKIFVLQIIYSAIVILFLLLPSFTCLGGESDAQKDIWKTIPPSAPVEKVEEWKSRRNIIEKEYDVCLEHCGYEKNCEKKCEDAYTSRLTREHKMMFYKEEQGMDK